ncbi:MAG: methyl-accepting chemotaxis protein [Bacteroidales bacterium]|nr:methyl-accepting chemotaxis protein [Bacteroidales bacterium]
MESNSLVLLIAAFAGIFISIAVARLLFKASITYWVGIFFIIMVNITLALTSIEFSKNAAIDKIIGLTALIASSLVLMKFFDNLIGKSLRNMTEKIDLVAEGKLQTEIDDSYLHRKSEVGYLARSLNKMVKNLNQSVDLAKMVARGELYFNIDDLNENADLDSALKDMVLKLREMSSNIKMAAEQVGVGSNQLSSTAQLLAQGANEQASSAEEIASTMEQMAVTNEQNTENAKRTDQIARGVAHDIETVNASIEKTYEAMKNISDKISIINDIAEKTDILAINAAIEAARAGEYGKGFAVVASEVRELAEHSQKAADEIVKVSELSKVQVEQSKQLLEKVYPEIKRTSTLVNEIAAATLEQSKGIHEVNQGIQQLSTVIQQNSASSEEMAASSEELNSQADQLNDSMSFFKITRSEGENLSESEIRMKISKLTELLESKNIAKYHKKSPGKTMQKPPEKKKKEGFDLKLDDDFEKY